MNVPEPTVSVDPKQEAKEEPKLTERADNRVQQAVNKANEAEQARQSAESRAAQAEETIKRLVNMQPTVTPEETLSKQFKTFDPNIGYPTDPREFAQYVQANAERKAEQRARETSKQERDQREMQDMLEENPDVTKDNILMAAIAAKRAQNPNVSYVSAARQAKKELDERYKDKVTSEVSSDTQAKNEAYVETTRGASTNRSQSSTPKDPDDMSLEEMEAYLKQQKRWDE